eukprot:7390649-Prymnesium_polylepis.1
MSTSCPMSPVSTVPITCAEAGGAHMSKSLPGCRGSRGAKLPPWGRRPRGWGDRHRASGIARTSVGRPGCGPSLAVCRGRLRCRRPSRRRLWPPTSPLPSVGETILRPQSSGRSPAPYRRAYHPDCAKKSSGKATHAARSAARRRRSAVQEGTTRVRVFGAGVGGQEAARNPRTPHRALAAACSARRAAYHGSTSAPRCVFFTTPRVTARR